MSDRAWLGSGTRDWADINLVDCKDLRNCAAQAAWHLPAKVYAEDPAILLQFFIHLDEDHAMEPQDFWHVAIWGRELLEHPSWDELEEYLGVRRPVCR